MTKEQILTKVQEIFRDVFDEDDLEINFKTNSNSIEDWDSLNHINLLSSIEQDFKIKFTMEESLSVKDVGEMIDLMIIRL